MIGDLSSLLKRSSFIEHPRHPVIVARNRNSAVFPGIPGNLSPYRVEVDAPTLIPPIALRSFTRYQSGIEILQVFQHIVNLIIH